MKIAWLLVSVCLITLVSDSAMSADFKLRNPGFEAGFSKSGIALGWQDNSSWAKVKVKYAPETENPHGGRYCQKIVSEKFVAFRQAAVPFIEPYLYRVSVWLRGTVRQVTVTIRQKGFPYSKYGTQTFDISKEWKKYEFETLAFDTDKRANLFINAKGSGELYVDDVSYEQVHREVKDNPYTHHAARDVPIPKVYFGMHNHRLWNPRFNNWPDVPFGIFRTHDAHVQWQLIQEGGKDSFDFKYLDQTVEKCLSNGIQILYTFVHTPKWASSDPSGSRTYPPRDIEDWNSFVKKVAERYKGKIKYYEIWNEPNTRFWKGSIDDLILLAKEANTIIKRIDPGAKVISPPPAMSTEYLDAYFRKGGANYADIIGYHFYVRPRPPEQMIVDIVRVKEIMKKHGVDKPLWNTEAGWDIAGTVKRTGTDPETFAKFISRSYIIQWACGIESYCYYSWDAKTMGLYDQSSRKILPSAEAYATTYGWLVGSTMEYLRRKKDYTWVCSLRHASGERAFILWNAKNELDAAVPLEWSVREIAGLQGKLQGPKITISDAPIYILCGNKEAKIDDMLTGE